MRFFHLKRPRSPQNRSRLYPMYGLVGLILALSIALGVMTFLRVRDNRQLNFTHEQLRASIQSDLTMVLRTYDEMSLPNAKIATLLLPTMRKHLYSAYTMNNVLIDAYGVSQSILGNDFYTQVTDAIDDVDRKISQGQIVDVTKIELGSCMAQMQNVLAAHFGNDGWLSQTALS